MSVFYLPNFNTQKRFRMKKLFSALCIKIPRLQKSEIFGDVGVVYLESVENFDLICIGFRSSLFFQNLSACKRSVVHIKHISEEKSLLQTF